jgi:hypothetical protein
MVVISVRLSGFMGAPRLKTSNKIIASIDKLYQPAPVLASIEPGLQSRWQA